MNGRIEIGVEKGKTIVSVFDTWFDEDNLIRILAGISVFILSNTRPKKIADSNAYNPKKEEIIRLINWFKEPLTETCKTGFWQSVKERDWKIPFPKDLTFKVILVDGKTFFVSNVKNISEVENTAIFIVKEYYKMNPEKQEEMLKNKIQDDLKFLPKLFSDFAINDMADVIMENLKNKGNSCKVPSLKEYLKN